MIIIVFTSIYSIIVYTVPVLYCTIGITIHIIHIILSVKLKLRIPYTVTSIK